MGKFKKSPILGVVILGHNGRKIYLENKKAYKRVARNEFIELIVKKSKREVIQEIISQLKLSGIELTEKDSRELYISLLTSNCTNNIVRIIYEYIESAIKDILYEANACSRISLNLMRGISIIATKIPKRNKINNFTGQKQTYKAYVKPKVEFSKVFIKNISK